MKSLPDNNQHNIEVTLSVKEVKRRQPNLTVEANELLPLLTDVTSALKDEEFEDYKTEVEKRIAKLNVFKDRIEGMRRRGTQIFSVIKEVEDTIGNPEAVLNPDRTKKVNPMNQWTAIPFSVEDQVIANRILDLIKKSKEESNKNQSITVVLKPKDVIYLCNRMIKQCGFYTVLGNHIVEMYDYFSSLKVEAETGKRKAKTGK